MVLFPPPFYFVFDISNLLSYNKIISSYELACPVMGTIFLVYYEACLNEKVGFKRPTKRYRKNSISSGALLSGLPV